MDCSNNTEAVRRVRPQPTGGRREASPSTSLPTQYKINANNRGEAAWMARASHGKVQSSPRQSSPRGDTVSRLMSSNPLEDDVFGAGFESDFVAACLPEAVYHQKYELADGGKLLNSRSGSLSAGSAAGSMRRGGSAALVSPQASEDEGEDTGSSSSRSRPIPIPRRNRYRYANFDGFSLSG